MITVIVLLTYCTTSLILIKVLLVLQKNFVCYVYENIFSQKSYWCGMSGKEENLAEARASNVNKHEPIPPGHTIGVKIRGLRKVLS